MLPSLLSTKFYIPPARTDAVQRPLLMEKLRSAAQQPGSFVLVSGSPGFGKTTLLSAWVAGLQQPAAWLSLDGGDNDPHRFWSYLIQACQTAADGFGETALAILRQAQPLPDEAIPALLINDLAALERPLTLVLDDFHSIENPALQAGFMLLLDHLPQNLHLIVSTRTDPPWPLARYRARNQLVEIRTRDLRFSQSEAAEFLNRSMGLDLAPEALAALAERTEGWAAGLQLAALSMQGRSDTRAFIQAFTGSNVYIAEYLVDEVLKRQPAEVQAFLLQTSILERLNGELCQAVCGCQDGQGTLKALQQANIFIMPLDDDGRWYRYHHLFADLLKARLQGSLAKTELENLHQNAARWFEARGMSSEAVEHYLLAADDAQAVRLVEAAALPMILQAEVRTVERWLQAIPAEAAQNSPRINMACAWMELLRGAALQAMPFIERLRGFFAAAPESMDPSLQAEWLAIQAELLIAQGRPLESRDLAIQAQAMLPQVEPNVRSMLYASLAKAYQLTLDYERAAEVFQMIVQDARRIGDMTLEVLGTSGQAQMFLKQGRLQRTQQVAAEGIRRLEASGRKVSFSATLYGELGQVNYHWHQLDAAREYLRRSMEMSGKSGYSDPEIYLHIMLSKMCQMQGDLPGAVREVEQAGRLASLVPPVMVHADLLAQQVRVQLMLNQPGAAEQLLAGEGFHLGETFDFPALPPGAPVTLEMGLLYNSALRVILYRATNAQDQRHLRRGLELGECVCAGELRCQHLPGALETLLLLGQMHSALGQAQPGLAAVARALELAEAEGFISPFVEEDAPLAALLNSLLAGGMPLKVRPAYIRQILAAFCAPPGAQVEAQKPAAAVPPLVEPLSARELEVLRLIAAGDSNRQIAEKLVITVSAVKKHSGNIYGKLNVNSRTQAVSRARQLGLLASGG